MQGGLSQSVRLLVLVAAFITPVLPQQPPRDIATLKTAAEKGDAAAQFNLGVMYGTGQGVTQDYVLTHMWINLAASRVKGDDQRKYAEVRDRVSAKMTSEQIAEAQKRARRWKPGMPSMR